VRTPVSDAEEVQRSSHRIQPLLSVRPPEGGAWVPVVTREATVTLHEIGIANTRSLAATIMMDDPDGNSILNTDLWSPFGSWIKAEQLIYRNDGSTFLVPWGFFRLNSYTVDIFTGDIDFQATDAFSQLADFSLQSLRDHQLAKSDSKRTRLLDMITETFTTIPAFWTTLIDWGTYSSNNTKSATNYVHPNDDRAEFCRMITSQLNTSARLVCPASGPLFSVVTLREPEVTEASADAVIMDGPFGNLVDEGFTDSTDRADMFNNVVVTYTKITPITGARTRTEQRRMIVTYDDAEEELRASGPFGKITQTAIALDVTTDADALAKGMEAITGSFNATRRVDLRCSPVYGIEPGDTLYVRTPTSIAMTGRLVGATIPLHADGGPWSLSMINYKALDQGWKPQYKIITDASSEEDLAEWKPFAPKTRIALDTGFPTGWTVSGGTVKVAKSKVTMQVISNGGVVIMKTNQRWSDTNAEHRYRARASVGLNNRAAYLDIGIHYMPQNKIVWSKRVYLAAKKSKTLSVDVTVPASATSFGVYVRFSNSARGSDFRLYACTVEKAVRKKV
jgi:hypothetical protein